MAEPALDRRQSLAGIPALNRGVSWRLNDKQEVTLCVPRQRRAGWLGHFQPPRWESRYQLDTLGSFVVQQIDGKRTVLEITGNFAAHFRVNRREAEIATVSFMKMLLERNIISIGIR